MDLSLSERRREVIAGFAGSLAPLAGKLGVVMLQFPHKEPQPEAALDLVGALPDDVSYALDFRTDGWDTPELRAELARRGATVCWTDRTGEIPAELPPGPIAYVRLRMERYDGQQRAAWSDALVSEARRRDVYAFVKHESGPADDPHAGVALARWLHTTTASS